MKKLLLVAIITATCGNAVAQTTSRNASMSWTLPTARQNGVALTTNELKQVNVYLDNAIVQTLPGSTTSGVTADCVKGTYAISVTDTAGNESDKSNAVAVDLTGRAACSPKPNAPVLAIPVVK